MQITSGEGKSLLSAILTATYALSGYQVTFVHHTKELRDHASFEFQPLYEQLKVADSISFTTVDQVWEDLNNPESKEKEMTKKSRRSSQCGEPQPSRRALVIDDADLVSDGDAIHPVWVKIVEARKAASKGDGQSQAPKISEIQTLVGFVSAPAAWKGMFPDLEILEVPSLFVPSEETSPSHIEVVSPDASSGGWRPYQYFFKN